MVPILMTGNNITQPGDLLQKITLEEWMHKIIKPPAALAAFIERLRTIRAMDDSLYREQKKKLPYAVCGYFHPPTRRKENFASIQCFIIDLDHIRQHDTDIDSLKKKLSADPRLAAAFASPGNDGLKLIYVLHDKCNDAALFSAFYKVFCKHLSDQFHLQGMIDIRTSDVTRACFISTDPQALYRPNAEPVAIQQYISGLDFQQAEAAIKEAENFLKENNQQRKLQNPQSLDEDVLLKIKQKLNPNFKPRPAKQYYIPPEIDQKLPLIEQWLHDAGITIIQTNPINFGKKIRIAAGNLWAELNIFYGKNGFTVVKTPKSGSHPQLADLAWQLLQQQLSSLK